MGLGIDFVGSRQRAGIGHDFRVSWQLTGSWVIGLFGNWRTGGVDLRDGCVISTMFWRGWRVVHFWGGLADLISVCVCGFLGMRDHDWIELI